MRAERPQIHTVEEVAIPPVHPGEQVVVPPGSPRGRGGHPLGSPDGEVAHLDRANVAALARMEDPGPNRPEDVIPTQMDGGIEPEATRVPVEVSMSLPPV